MADTVAATSDEKTAVPPGELLPDAMGSAAFLTSEATAGGAPEGAGAPPTNPEEPPVGVQVVPGATAYQIGAAGGLHSANCVRSALQIRAPAAEHELSSLGSKGAATATPQKANTAGMAMKAESTRIAKTL
ncbi:hypothetical protein QFC21_003127 [Naganishia friedmannii]|uniref:Uncharacterized protein n=1 Tax=Naganishia friedmannii TaxID=89922 RepID=A0ACC2VRI9_9TREE|nr:hypothetical protein QFC21_003127 [Naganishia friedmannii]